MKKFYTIIYFLSVFALNLTIHNIYATGRGPSIDPVTEIDVQEAPKDTPGFDFSSKETKRVPANIVSKNSDQKTNTNTYSYLGPILFLIAIPLALWLFVSRKLKDVDTEMASSHDKKTHYYSKTSQFSPYKTDYQKADEEDDEDINFPKAS